MAGSGACSELVVVSTATAASMPPLLSVADNSSRRRLAIVRVSGSALSFGNDWSSASITCAWVASDTDCAT